MRYQERFYRKIVSDEQNPGFQVTVKETDLLVHAPVEIKDKVREVILKQRGYIEAHIAAFPLFATTLKPLDLTAPAPEIIRDMAAAAQKTGIGPMAAVAGATTISATKIIANNGNPTLTKTLPKSAMKTDRGKLKKSQTRSHRRKRAKRLGLVRLKTQADEPLPVSRPRPHSRPIAKPTNQWRR